MTPHSLIRILMLLGFVALPAGCAHNALTPVHVRAGQATPWPPIREGQGLIIEFKAGDRIPVSIQVDGEIIETTPNPSTVWLTAKRDFSVRMLGSELKTSLDGVHFDEKPAVPGRFQLGLEATREAGERVVVHITTPVHAKP